MNPSKIGREIILAALVLVFYFMGVFVGKHPSVFSSYIRITQTELKVFVADPSQFPTALQSLVSAKAQMQISWIFSEDKISSADLWLGDFADLSRREILADEIERQDWQNLLQKVSPDFRLALFQKKHFLPLLWRQDNGLIRVLGLRINNENSVHRKEILALEQAFLADDFQKSWLQRVTWNTTLLRLDEAAIPEDRRASAIRRIPLLNLHWGF